MGAAGRIWSAAAHPRGPNGRFIKGGGGNSASTSRPSLAEAVRGTAAGGPKRQRADRLASPANSSAPTPRSSPRPGSAAAMFAAGAGKGRIHAATSRPPATPARAATTAPNARPKPSKKLGGLTDQQLTNGMQMHGNQSTTGRAIQVEAQRRKVDAAKAVPNPPASKAPPLTRPGKVLDVQRVTDIGDRLTGLADRGEARNYLAGLRLTVPQLRQLAAHLGATVGSKYTQAQLLDRLVEIPGRRADSNAIRRMAAAPKNSARQMMTSG